MSARLYHAAGGMGKTRLFVEWCEQLRKEGWVAGFLVRSPDLERIKALLESRQDVLVVIDYAESRQRLGELLEAVARQRNAGRQALFRLVLLARNAGDWWSATLVKEGVIRDLFEGSEPIPLLPLVGERQDRQTLFQEAIECFAAALGKAPAPRLPPPDLSDKRFERVLYIHMAALATVNGWPIQAERLLEETLDHEERFWRNRMLVRLPTDDDWRLFLPKIRRAVAALTLVGGTADEQSASDLLQQVNRTQDDLLLLVLRDLYPGSRQLADTSYLSGLEPDLLGEAVVLRTLRQERDGGSSLLERIFDTADARELRNGFEVLGRLCIDYSDEAGRWIAHILEKNLTDRAVIAFEAAKAVGEKTAHSDIGLHLARALEAKGNSSIAEQLEDAVIPEHTVSLMEVALWVTKSLLERLSKRRPSQNNKAIYYAETARLLTNLTRWQSALGKREEALKSARSAAECCRWLAKNWPDRFISELIASLIGLGTAQTDLGMLEDALASYQESVELCRQPAQTQSERLAPDLALSLNNLSSALIRLGRWNEALRTISESEMIYRRLSKEHPGKFLSQLAMSLMNLGAIQSSMGEHAKALAATQEAVDHYRHLAKDHPDAFLLDVAMSLQNLAARQIDNDMRENAMQSIHEAVSLYRRMAAKRPDIFDNNLADGLINLGVTQGAIGEIDDALDSTLEAVNIFRQLVERRPEIFLSDLADGLLNLGILQSAVGNEIEALVTTKEAIGYFRDLVKRRPKVFLENLANGLSSQSARQEQMEMTQDAIASLREALHCYEHLAEERPVVFLPKLASNKYALSVMLRNLGMLEEALQLAHEAVGCCLDASSAGVAMSQSMLVILLINLGTLQINLGVPGKALETTLEALEILEPLRESLTDLFEERKIEILENIQSCVEALGFQEGPVWIKIDHEMFG